MRRRRSITPGFIATSTLMLALCTAIAAAAMWPVYQSPQFVIMVAVTFAVAAAIAITGAVFRLPGHVVVLAGAVAYLALGVPLAVPTQAISGVIPTLGGLGDLVVGTALSWKQLLTISLPVGSYESLLVPPFLLVLVTVIAALSVALRARFGELAVLGPILLFLAGIIFGPTTEFFPRVIGLSLTAAVLLWLGWFRWYRRRAAVLVRGGHAAEPDGKSRQDSALTGLRALVSGGLIVLLAASGAVTAAGLVPPSGSRDVLRSAVVQPFDPREYASPLSSFRRYLQGANASSTMLTVAGLPPGARMRIATLDRYNGIVYSVGSDRVSSESGSFTLIPSRFDQSAVGGVQVAADVTVGSYSGVWLPTVGKLESVTFSGSDAARLRGSLFYNDYSGTAAVVNELAAGDRYRLTAAIPDGPSETQLAGSTPGDAQLPAIGPLPGELSVALDRYVGQTVGEGRRLAAAIAGLRENGYISHGVSSTEPPSRSGHSADRITELFAKPQMIGDEEQYAVAAALMAHELGFPARVVIGFLPPAPGPDGVSVVTGANISAWIEVDTSQFGWVTIDPTPPVRPIPAAVPDVPTQVARPQSPVRPPVDEPVISDERIPPSTAQEPTPAADPMIALLAAAIQIGGWTLLAIAILLSPFVVIIAAKMRRRRLRRRAREPLERISGGWHEFEDAVLDHGYSPNPASTRSEFAGVVGGAQSAILAAVTDRAVFAPTPPDTTDADLVWRSVDELRASLRVGLTRRERIRARISLRSLGGRGVIRSLSRPRRST